MGQDRLLHSCGELSLPEAIDKHDFAVARRKLEQQIKSPKAGYRRIEQRIIITAGGRCLKWQTVDELMVEK